ncbi:MAG: transporter [Firmicutes bacterium]|nr:transporter [Bacillota bacterium]
MFQEMRRQDRMLTTEETTEILQNGSYGILSLNGQRSDDYAYGIPMNYVYKNNCIYVHCAMEGKKLSHIQTNNKVSFCVVGNSTVLPEKFSTLYSSVIAFGQGHLIDGEEKTAALLALIDKYSADFKEKGELYVASDKDKTLVIKITIDHMTGKARKA